MSTHTIAVIDDSRTWVEAVSEVLNEEGFQVRTAANGSEAVDLLDHVRPELVILDIDLPDASGLQILTDFRAHDRTTPVLVVSANDRASVRDRAMSFGASGFLRKPVPAAVLVQALRRLLPLAPA